MIFQKILGHLFVSFADDCFCFVWVEALRPSQQFFSHVGTEPPLPGYYQYFLGGKCILLKDAIQLMTVFCIYRHIKYPMDCQILQDDLNSLVNRPGVNYFEM